MKIIRAIKHFLNGNEHNDLTTTVTESTTTTNRSTMNKAYYDLLNQRIMRRQDNLVKLQRAVKEMQTTFKENQTNASHVANIAALNAMLDIEEQELAEEIY
ncbi:MULTISPECIES: hypothetical protein [Flammeovirga]|uniref:Uncharacterized protein n=1 Tax=Flammeovirga agarivorans TaxID=2726742 RepID=A0A7X8SPS7_9BACT|nr:MULTISPECIES: hypothetical protein [Flammeovirga]NLR94134.1 hypothetical protein [Flammeovirga agarivorans]